MASACTILLITCDEQVFGTQIPIFKPSLLFGLDSMNLQNKTKTNNIKMYSPRATWWSHSWSIRKLAGASVNCSGGRLNILRFKRYTCLRIPLGNNAPAILRFEFFSLQNGKTLIKVTLFHEIARKYSRRQFSPRIKN